MSDLDMYLTKKYYIKTWPHTEKEDIYEVKITKGGNTSSIQTEKIAFIDAEEIYWKDALAIHLWFVKNVQKGIEDEGEHLVPENKLLELQKIINDIIDDRTKAEKLLPDPDEKYAEEYFDTLIFTKNQLSRILAAQDEDGEFYYSASE